MEKRISHGFKTLGMTIMIISICMVISEGSRADVEPNGSLDDPEEISPGSVSGDVTTNYYLVGNEYQIDVDNDIYSITVPGMSNLTVELKKTDNNTDAIKIDSYDENNMESHMIYARVFIPDEVSRDVYTNEDANRTLVKMLVQGNGSYRIDVDIDEIPVDYLARWEEHEDDDDLREQTHHSYETAKRIEPGIYNGSVNDTSYTAERYYRITVAKGRKLKIGLEKTDDYEGSIYLKTYLEGEYYGHPDDMMLDVNLDRRRDSGYWENTESNEKLVIFGLEGRGNYTIEVEIEDGERIEPWFLTIIVIVLLILVMLCSMVIPFTIIIVIILVIMKKNTSSKRKSTIKKKRHRSKKGSKKKKKDPTN